MPQIVLTFIFAALIASAAAAQTFQQGEPPTAQNQTTILVTTIIGFAGLIVTQIFQMLNAARARRWEKEDRAAAREEARQLAEAAREEVRKHAQVQRLETIQTAIDLAKVSNVNRKQLLEQIEHNTNISQQAKDNALAAYAMAEATFTAANNFNAKYEELRKQLLSKSDTIDHIDEVSSDTNVRVTSLTEKEQKAEKEPKHTKGS